MYRVRFGHADTGFTSFQRGLAKGDSKLLSAVIRRLKDQTSISLSRSLSAFLSPPSMHK